MKGTIKLQENLWKSSNSILNLNLNWTSETLDCVPIAFSCLEFSFLFSDGTKSYINRLNWCEKQPIFKTTELLYKGLVKIESNLKKEELNLYFNNGTLIKEKWENIKEVHSFSEDKNASVRNKTISNMMSVLKQCSRGINFEEKLLINTKSYLEQIILFEKF